ncbi:hypothetical protein ILYODFUR_038732 [Ilyodon furcidens]|uniref:Uncharacterized protein n=1 Tax=Ilyodon furcidens TaxID=33524 RepID=A0ABV0SSS7_9TELE
MRRYEHLLVFSRYSSLSGFILLMCSVDILHIFKDYQHISAAVNSEFVLLISSFGTEPFSSLKLGQLLASTYKELPGPNTPLEICSINISAPVLACRVIWRFMGISPPFFTRQLCHQSTDY